MPFLYSPIAPAVARAERVVSRIGWRAADVALNAVAVGAWVVWLGLEEAQRRLGAR